MAIVNGSKATHSVRMVPCPMMTNLHTPTDATNSIGVVLAGGKSSRMGYDKALLSLGNTPLLLHARSLLQAAGCSQVLMSGAPRPEWLDESISDLAPSSGPVGGIISVIHQITRHARPELTMLFIPVDAPLLSPELLRALMNKTEMDGCIIDDTPLPVALRITNAVLTQCSATLPNLLEGKSQSIKRFLQPLHLAHLSQTGAIKPQLTNVNTPVEWEGVCRELENRA